MHSSNRNFSDRKASRQTVVQEGKRRESIARRTYLVQLREKLKQDVASSPKNANAHHHHLKNKSLSDIVKEKTDEMRRERQRRRRTLTNTLGGGLPDLSPDALKKNSIEEQEQSLVVVSKSSPLLPGLRRGSNGVASMPASMPASLPGSRPVSPPRSTAMRRSSHFEGNKQMLSLGPTLPGLKRSSVGSGDQTGHLAPLSIGDAVYAPAWPKRKRSQVLYRLDWARGHVTTAYVDGLNYDIKFDRTLKYEPGRLVRREFIISEEERAKEERRLVAPAARMVAATKYGMLTPDTELEHDRPLLARAYQAMEGHKWQDQGHWMTRRPITLWKGVNLDQDTLNGLVYTLHLKGKNLSVPFPIQLCDLTNLRKLNLERNMLTGEIPAAIAQLFELRELILSHNNLEGNLPLELVTIMNLHLIDVAYNFAMAGPIEPSLLEKGGLTIKKRKTGLIGKEANLSVPLYPLFVVPKEKLLKLTQLIPHEEAGLVGKPAPPSVVAAWRLGDLEDLEDLELEGILLLLQGHTAFQCWTSSQGMVGRNELCFISHRWIRQAGPHPHPDTSTNAKLKYMQEIAKDMEHVKYFWIDYMCAPQRVRNKRSKILAIHSMPHYVKSCGTFVALTIGSSSRRSRRQYCSRGWCRYERLIALCPVAYSTAEGLGEELLENMVVAMHKTIDAEEEEKEFEDSGTESEDETITIKGVSITKKKKRDSKVESWVTTLQSELFMNPLKGSFMHESDKISILPGLQMLCSNYMLKTAPEMGFMGLGDRILESERFTDTLLVCPEGMDEVYAQDMVTCYVNELDEQAVPSVICTIC